MKQLKIDGKKVEPVLRGKSETRDHRQRLIGERDRAGSVPFGQLLLDQRVKAQEELVVDVIHEYFLDEGPVLAFEHPGVVLPRVHEFLHGPVHRLNKLRVAFRIGGMGREIRNLAVGEYPLVAERVRVEDVGDVRQRLPFGTGQFNFSHYA
jgi:hypothetical protein